MSKSSLSYLAMLALAAALVMALLQQGATLPPPPGGNAATSLLAAPAAAEAPVLGAWGAQLRRQLDHPLSHLFLQLIVIIGAAQLLGRLFQRFGQPAVVGEMAAGILLGPSLFGWALPSAFAFVFPTDSLAALKLLSQLGVCLFMFTVGMDLRPAQLRGKAASAVAVSHASIVLPFLLGVLLAYFLYSELAAPRASFSTFALFIGVAMSITAFPVLARILQERGLAHTPLGSTALTCAAVDDVTAWSLLAFVVAIAQAGSLAAAGLNLLLVLGFVLLMLFAVRPALAGGLGPRLAAEAPSKGVLALVVCVVLAAALSTEAIGIHALFGAFLAGAIMPEREGFRAKIHVRVEHFSSVLLLPLFFAFTGLRTQLGLLEGWQDWLLCGLIIAVASLGKLGGSALAARLTGMAWRESLMLGALMNTRGLMELIALNIGYELGILSPRIFTMLVIMALATTLMTAPLLSAFAQRATSTTRPRPPTP